ncbi:hypothetical protein KKH39_02825 [Patescibacteria group bacterium]|nr:hypothetical protein [Patescibacteria group bacterium]
MKSVLLTILSAFTMLAIALFNSQPVVVGLGLTIVGLTFARPLTNWREVLAMVLLGISGPLMLLDYNWLSILPSLAGIMLIVATIGQQNDGFVLLKVSIGVTWVSWLFVNSSSLAVPRVCVLSAFLMGLMSLVMFLGLSLPDYPTEHYYTEQGD